MLPARRKSSTANARMALGIAVAAGVGGWALVAVLHAGSPPSAVVDDCNAEAQMAARLQGAPPEVAAGSLPDAGVLHGITTLSDLSAAGRLAYSRCLERRGYSQASNAGGEEQS